MGRKINTLVNDEGRKPLNKSRPHNFTIVLQNPRIPQNTGSIARMCAALNCRLDIINPLFEIDDKRLKRAGLDYWHLLDVRFFDDNPHWLKENPLAAPWLVEIGSNNIYTEMNFSKKDYFFFGDEQEGVEQSLLADSPSKHISIPQAGVRSLNLATCVAVISFEAVRQVGWGNLQYNSQINSYL